MAVSQMLHWWDLSAASQLGGFQSVADVYIHFCIAEV